MPALITFGRVLFAVLFIYRARPSCSPFGTTRMIADQGRHSRRCSRPIPRNSKP